MAEQTKKSDQEEQTKKSDQAEQTKQSDQQDALRREIRDNTALRAQKRMSRIRAATVATGGAMVGLAASSMKSGANVASNSFNSGAQRHKSALIVLFLAIALVALDLLWGINSINYPWEGLFGVNAAEQGMMIAKNAVFIIIVVSFLMLRGIPKSGGEIAFYVFAAAALAVTFNLIAILSAWVFAHVAFAIYVFIFIGGFNRNTPISAVHWLWLFTMMWDIYDFPLTFWAVQNFVNSDILIFLTNNVLFPVWVIYAVSVLMEDSGLKTFLSITGVLICIVYFGATFVRISEADLRTTSAEAQLQILEAKPRFTRNILDLSNEFWQRQINFAVTGKVEENEFEPLGVYLDGLQTAEQEFFEGEDIVVWGTIRARTLNEPIKITSGCYIKGAKESSENGELLFAKSQPEEPFTVETSEEQDFTCVFDNSRKDPLKDTAHKVFAYADFNFETLAYQKIYFMDQDRYRAMTREGLDVFEEFGITDREPQARFTNGPARIGVDTPDLVRVTDKNIVNSMLRVQVQNQIGWEGDILHMKELVIFVPKEVEFFPDTCNMQFVDYTEEACTATCTDSNKEDKCKEICSSSFYEDEQYYNGYALSPIIIAEELRLSSHPNLDFSDRLRLFTCSFRPIFGEILGNTPITTKFFRFKTKYDYRVESALAIKIKKYPDDLIVKTRDVQPATDIRLTDWILTWTASKDDGEGEDDVGNYLIELQRGGSELREIASISFREKLEDGTYSFEIPQKHRASETGEKIPHCYRLITTDIDGNREESESLCGEDETNDKETVVEAGEERDLQAILSRNRTWLLLSSTKPQLSTSSDKIASTYNLLKSSPSKASLVHACSYRLCSKTSPFPLFSI